MKIRVNTVEGGVVLYHEHGNVVLRTEHGNVVLTPRQADRLALLLTQAAAAAFKAQYQRK